MKTDSQLGKKQQQSKQHGSKSDSATTPSISHQTAQKIWTDIVTQMRFECGNDVFRATFGGIEFLGIDGDTVQLHLSPTTDASWIQNQAQGALLKLWQKELAHITQIKLNTPSVSLAASTLTDATQESIQSSSITSFYKTKANKDFTFSNFVVGTSNLMAYLAAQTVASRDERAVSPLFLHGKVGLGKTHLLHAIAIELEQQKDYAIGLISAERFMNRFVEAIIRKDTLAFKEFFRSLDVLLVDDIHFLSHKEKAQEELLHTFNELIDNRCQIVVASTSPPNLLEGFDERIRSRLSSGLVAQLKTYDTKQRLDIIRAKLKQKRTSLPDSVLHFLAEEIDTDVRDIEGTINHIIAYRQLDKEKNFNINDLKLILKDVTRHKKKAVSIEDIQVTVAKHFQIKTTDLQSASRQKNVVIPRHIAMYLAKENTKASLTTIGKYFGKRDHSTVQHAVNRISKDLSTNPILLQDIETLRQVLTQN